ncbi:hypothetical protein K505DRAFT_353095 [Melanomma pulvis-pyrius CBS 109.77]|uniref:Uncharacterized protein n=1 Tax=Melanomma pulvis-pyrius CBS 109.77 TaxID=1314802 RepID=A0A6A6WWY7_9PLEO|nr:hypothetical protein K505DRAFT_353095 [Melanomma pulvis-pyrius CBS 109.77]
MALQLYISPCIHKSPHRLHPPPADKPLRNQIQGPLDSVQKLLPTVLWSNIMPFLQPGMLMFARLIHQILCDAPTDYRPFSHIDGYGVAFDHLISVDEPDPEVLAIDIIEVDKNVGLYADGGKYANQVVLSSVLAVPICYSMVAERDSEVRACS